MGLISGVLLLPLAPVRGVEWIADRVLEAAEREMCDPALLRVRLRELNRAYEAGELSEEEFEREEEHLLDHLEKQAPLVGPTAVTRTRTHVHADAHAYAHSDPRTDSHSDPDTWSPRSSHA
jgi:hypothetical protein